jgi:hypothetical protein
MEFLLQRMYSVRDMDGTSCKVRDMDLPRVSLSHVILRLDRVILIFPLQPIGLFDKLVLLNALIFIVSMKLDFIKFGNNGGSSSFLLSHFLKLYFDTN